MNRTQRIIKDILTDGESLKYHYLSLEVSRMTLYRWRQGISEPYGQLKTRLDNYYTQWKQKHQTDK